MRKGIDKLYLNEDGSINREKIDKLPIDEFGKVLGCMTQSEYREYNSIPPINVKQGPIRVRKGGYSIKKELANGAVIADDDYFRELKEKIRKL